MQTLWLRFSRSLDMRLRTRQAFRPTTYKEKIIVSWYQGVFKYITVHNGETRFYIFVFDQNFGTPFAAKFSHEKIS